MQKGRRIRRPFCLEFSRRDGSSGIHQNKPDGTGETPEHRQSPFVDGWAVQIREEEFYD